MIHVRDIPKSLWKISLVSVAAIWGGSFVVLKDALDSITPARLMAIRFALTTLIIGLIFQRRILAHLDRKHLANGAILGLAYGGGYLLQTYGLAGTTPGKNAFLTSVYCVIVPLLNWLLIRKRPGANSFVAAVLAVAGVGLVSLSATGEGGLNSGDALTLCCSVMYAIHIVLVPRYARDCDVMTITLVQLATCAMMCFIAGIGFEPAPALSVVTPELVGAFAYLVLLASCYAMVMQNFAQSIVEPASAALIMSLESVFAVLASVLFYGEQLTAREIAGFALIFLAVLLSEAVPMIRGKIATTG